VLLPLIVLASAIVLLVGLGISAAALNHRDGSMRRFPRTKLLSGGAVAFAVLFLLFGPASGGHPEAAADSDIIPGRYIVVLKKSASPSAVASRHGLRPQVVYKSALRGFAGSFSDKAVRRLRADPSVLLVEPDRVATVDDAQTLPFGIDRVDADLNLTAKIDGVDDPLDVDIAIIDTGIQLDHPDLRVAGGVRFIGSDCAGGSWADDHGHGTHVAGTAAAIDNSIGVVGMAPGARLWAVKVLNQNGSGSLSCIIEAVDWVTANAATIEVANISIRTSPSTALCQAITTSAAAGVVYAVSAGNNATDASSQSPANCPDVLATSAIADFDGQSGGLDPRTVGFSLCTMTGDDIFACFSNYGPRVDIAAPGVNIYSTYKGGGYATMSGTSMASPHVAGAAALDIVEQGKPTDADGAAAVRGRLIAAGANQDGFFGFSGDPDDYHEPLLLVWPAGAYDVAVTVVPPPPFIIQGDLAQIDVTLAHQGSSNQTLSVALAASSGAVPDSPQTVTLEPDSSTTVSFIWDTTGLPLADYTLTATATSATADMYPANDSRSITARVRALEHDVAVVAINAPAVVVIGLDSTAGVEVTAANPGTFDETFSVSLEASGGAVSGSPQEVTLAFESSTTVSFTWDTTGLSPAEYTLTATASVVPEETDTADNSSSTAVTVRLPVHDVAVVGLDAPSAAAEGSQVPVHVTATNGGEVSETFSVSLEASGGSVEDSPQTIALIPGGSAALSFTWYTPDARPDPYTLTVEAEPVPGEESVSDNSLAAEVLVTVLQDIVVNSSADPGSGLCDAMECTLREAILLANATPGPARISFNILGGSPQTIAPLSALPDITAPVTIDGTTQPGYAGTPIIELNGEAIGATADGLRVVGGGSTIRGMVINRFTDEGIRLSGKGGNAVQGNFIGTDVTGTVALGNWNIDIIVSGSPYSSIGGTAPGAGNVISGTSTGRSGPGVYGIGLRVESSSGTVIQGNRIGTDVTGTADLGNVRWGIWVTDSTNTTIGGTAPGAGNVISGNGENGIDLYSGNSRTIIQGNLIGTDVTGTVALGNGKDGIILNGSPYTTIGGTAPGAGNVVSANGWRGIFIGDTAPGPVIQGNHVGTDITGTSALGNQRDGVYISRTQNTMLGGTAAGAANTIAYNHAQGVIVAGATARGNTIRGNSIHSNDGLGIYIDPGSNGGVAPPTITAAGPVSGTACANCTVDVYSDDSYQGWSYHGSTQADDAGNWSFPGGASGPRFTATATDASGNTSEFSAGFLCEGGCPASTPTPTPPPGFLPPYVLKDPTTQTNTYFGRSVAVGDVDGDGKGDIAVGASDEDVNGNTDQGRAYVFSGATSSLLLTLDTPNPQAGAWSGYSVAVGDINGDDKADIALGAPSENVDGNEYQGRAYVFSGANGSLLFTLDTPNPQGSAGFGASVAMGDVDGDGNADIAVGATWEGVSGNAYQGRAYVFSGADGSLLFTLDTPNPQAFARFGWALAVGDANGDGKADIAVGAILEDVSGNAYQGRAYVFSGADGSLLFTLDTPNPQTYARFGSSVGVGDANADGKGDIAVGVPYEDVSGNGDQGRVHVFSGADGSLLFTLDTPNPQAMARFGDSVAMGDVDGNGTADIAVGASYEDVNDNSDQGRVHVFSGANGSPLFTLDTSNPQGGAYFGYSVAVGDVNGDGKGDMAAGASQGGCGRGAVYVLASTPDYSPTPTPTPTPTPAPPFDPVGGIAELPDAPLSAAANQVALAVLAAAALLALSAGGWYARRRWLR